MNNISQQEYFWNYLQQFKFDLYYFNNHFESCVVKLRCIKYIVTGITVISAILLIIWPTSQGLTVVCSIVVIILQALNAFSDIFPFNNRKDELRDLCRELEFLYIEVENTWKKIAEGELMISEIEKSILEYKKRRHEIEINYFKNDFLKEEKKIVDKSNKQTQRYFEYF